MSCLIKPVIIRNVVSCLVFICGLTMLLNGCVAMKKIDSAFPHTVTVNYDFDKTVDFLSEEIGTHVTQWTNSAYFTYVCPSNIMNNNSTYFFGTKKYIPGNKLVFEMWGEQIGREWNTFTVTRKSSEKTNISLSQFAEAMIFFSFCRQNEINILSNIVRRADQGHSSKARSQ